MFLRPLLIHGVVHADMLVLLIDDVPLGRRNQTSGSRMAWNRMNNSMVWLNNSMAWSRLINKLPMIFNKLYIKKKQNFEKI